MNGTTAVKCYNEIGLVAKNDRVNELLLTHFVSNNWNENKIDLEEVLTEVTFEEFIS
jgi:ribonuclease BN (tRNA processing enzyme)